MPPIKSPLFEALREIGQFLGKKIDGLSKTLTSFAKDIGNTQATHTRALTRAVETLQSHVTKIKDPVFSGEITIDSQQLAADLEAVTSEVRAIGENISVSMPDVTNIERALKLIYDATSDISDKNILEKLDKLTETVKKIEFPKKLEIDPNQIRSLRGAFGGGGGGGGGIAPAPNLIKPFSTTTVQAVGLTETSDFQWVSVHVITQGTSSTVTFQGSNDGTNFVSISLLNTAHVGSTVPAVSTAVAGIIFSGPVPYRYFRLNVTGISAGITSGVLVFSPTPPTNLTNQHAVTVTSSTALTPGVAATNLGKAEDAAHTSGDTGVFVLGVRNDNLATATPTSANGDYGAMSIDQHGAAYVRNRPATTATLSNVAGSASSVTILALNAARIGATVYNDSTAALYLKYGSTASSTSFTVKLYQDDYHEVPFGYSGILTGIWDSATGNARVTEITS